ncbi:MAG: hypothetical protein IJ466_07315 [Clostridia bacterium]|nr:hypothetical protein [Clostridia bacterium]
MNKYLHGAYGAGDPQSAREAVESQNAIIYLGTAPVHAVEGNAGKVNTPIVVRNIAEARRKLGYSDDWAKYSLCEAIHVHLQLGGVGPLVMINVLDPKKHKAAEGGSLTAKAANGQVRILAAEDAILDSIAIEGKEKGKDYAASYDCDKKIITISELVIGALGTEELSISWDKIDASLVTKEDAIGASDGAGLNSGLYAIKNVYQLTGYIPAHLVAPGFSSDPEFHEKMYEVSQQVNKHWHVYMRTDIPIMHEGTPVTLLNAATWKEAHGYNKENETTYFPLAKGTDGRIYHLSTLASGNLQALMVEQDGIPYTTPSNTDCPIIQNLYLGEESAVRVYDDELINEKLNRYGIASACYTGGRWAIWGAHSASYTYTPDSEYRSDVSETNMMMLYYVINSFQHRRAKDVDKIKTINDLKAIVADEQARLDALIGAKALIYGECMLDAKSLERSDIMEGNYRFAFRVTTTPIAKSLTAYAAQVKDGFDIYIDQMLTA